MVWVYRGAPDSCGTTILLTASRGATLATVVDAHHRPLTASAPRAGRKRVALLLTWLCSSEEFIFFVPETSWERLATSRGNSKQGTITGSTQSLGKAGWEICRAHPFVGIGANAFALSSAASWRSRFGRRQRTRRRPRHNTFLSACRTGRSRLRGVLRMMGAPLRFRSAYAAFPQRLWIVCWQSGLVGIQLDVGNAQAHWVLFGLLMGSAEAFPGCCCDNRFVRTPRLNAARPLGANHGPLEFPTQNTDGKPFSPEQNPVPDWQIESETKIKVVQIVPC